MIHLHPTHNKRQTKTKQKIFQSFQVYIHHHPFEVHKGHYSESVFFFGVGLALEVEDVCRDYRIRCLFFTLGNNMSYLSFLLCIHSNNHIPVLNLSSPMCRIQEGAIWRWPARFICLSISLPSSMTTCQEATPSQVQERDHWDHRNMDCYGPSGV